MHGLPPITSGSSVILVKGVISVPPLPNPSAHAFGNAYEAEAWRRFEAEMHVTDEGSWIGNGGSSRVSKDWVADLGHYLGYQIAKAYYDRTSDKRQAIRDLMELRDPDPILQASKYASRSSRQSTGPHHPSTARCSGAQWR
jgi:hypothetical protein